MVNAWKIGVGSGAVLLGLIILFSQQNMSEGVFGAFTLVFGVFLVATGIGLLASDK